jgi:hypothetical protein
MDENNQITLNRSGVYINRVDHATPFYPQKLALTLPTSGDRSVGIVRARTKATELLYQPVDKNIKLLFIDQVYIATSGWEYIIIICTAGVYSEQ